MVSPPDREQNQQFVRLAGVFHSAGIPVPEILDRDSTRGWYLLSDLGSRELETCYAGTDRDAALSAAIRTLLDIQRLDDPAIPPYTTERFADELTIFTEWFLGGVLEQEPPAQAGEAFALLVERARDQIQCCVHRDYHCRNLLYNDGALGVVDFQDALMGPVSYDLASLLYDCYYEFSPADVDRWTRVYLNQTPLDLDPRRFAIDRDFLAVQRQLKAIGIFARLKLRDRRTTHLAHILPVLGRVQRLAERHRPLQDLAAWLGTLEPESALTALARRGSP
jgi:aminoglycoside/choline kinase family phosphotransferase